MSFPSKRLSSPKEGTNPDSNLCPSAGRTMPRLSYRWVIVIVALAVTIMAYGVHYSFGVFFKPLQGEFDLGGDDTDLLSESSPSD